MTDDNRTESRVSASPEQRSEQDHRPADEQEQSLTDGLLHYIAILWRYRWFIAIVTVVAAMGVVAYAIISLRLPPEESYLPNVYTANAVILFQRPTGDSVTQSIMASIGLSAGTGAQDVGQLAALLLGSRSFLDEVAQDPGIIERYGLEPGDRTSARRIVSGGLSFAFDQRTRVLRLSYVDIDPVRAAYMAQTIMDALQRWFAERGGTDRMVAVQTMEEKIGDVEARIAEIEARIEGFQRQYGVVQVQDIAQRQSQLLGQFQGQLLDVELAISNQQRLSRIANDPELEVLRVRRQNLLDMIGRIEQGYTGGSDRLPPRDALPGLAADYARLTMELEIQTRIYQGLVERYEVARLAADTEPAFTVLEYPEVPEEKSGPTRGRMSAFVTAGAFFGSIAVSLLFHGLRTILKDPRKRRILSLQEPE